MTLVPVTDSVVFGRRELVLVAGPCVIESPAHVIELGRAIAAIAARVGMPYVFKASFDKANRTSASSFRGPGLTAGLKALQGVKDALGVPVLTDLHDASHAAAEHDGVGDRDEVHRRRSPIAVTLLVIPFCACA